MPRCDFVFASTRSCFIGYGFNESALEVEILKTILEDRGIQGIEAGGRLSPGQNAFCAKICSKIITAQFCIVLINSEGGAATPVTNPNVHMEYGLMLGFNKYIIPFQREGDTLPFNVAGLDTIKYSPMTLKAKAITAIDQAIRETRPENTAAGVLDQQVGTFLLTQKAVFTPVDTPSNRWLYDLGSPLGFNLLHDFSGEKFTFFGNFAVLRPEAIVWRAKLIDQIIRERRDALVARANERLLEGQDLEPFIRVLEDVRLWFRVTTDEDAQSVAGALLSLGYEERLRVFSLRTIEAELQKLDEGSV